MDTMEKYKKYVNTAFVKAVEPVVVEKASGSKIIDVDGKIYTDLYAGIAVANAGHVNPEVAAAAKAQIDKVVHSCAYVYHSIPVADLAEKLAEVTPGRLQKTFFGNGGAEANEGAMRMAKQFTKRTEFIALQGSFHGRSLATLSITGNKDRKKGGGPYASGISFHPSAYCYRCPYAMSYPACDMYCAKQLERTIQFDTAGDVAAFIAETMMGEGGIIIPPKEYYKEIKKVLDKYGILLFLDEVQCGYGRSGKLFAVEHYDVEPDIMTFAKGIADGFPLSAFIARPEIADSFKPGDHLSTFGGNPVSCAAGLANLNFMLREKIPEKALAKGEKVVGELKELQKKAPLIGDVRGSGLMIGIELVRDKAKTPANEEAGKIRAAMRQKGFLIGVGGTYGNVLRFQPPLVISSEELSAAVAALAESLKAL
ncbi:5-aminovalerate aminotransferase DavT [bioreactor metagenome]|jgi:4-aminobutyrate aminotransferase|uniref:alanine--glyoxylate transaminase n=1 Tax=bioreactor metagenome TaxID=1076179 RepID=A0A644V4G6_9ZZZZ|nr:aspartate aminotransferase family protein [Spirochaetia bacterium]NLX45037.1 aspartate aminotransferase family protein [Treponema sp.]VBB41270.1 4-aminobutyrate aminotransferase [uncultured Spirochaetota bacterium]HAP55009.1 aspartate aminotransferase family protein [Spirochaetaceae bacterium]HOI22604.1 aspartate aminotransferase family protein [Spirochaetales bacterium]